MNRLSLWQGTSQQPQFPSLTQNIETDVAVIGAGITGITAAMYLSEAGKNVAVVEANTIGSGTTACSTGNLHATVDQGIYLVNNKWDLETAQSVLESRSEIINSIENMVKKFNIECQFKRVPHFIYPTDDKQLNQIDQEFEVLASFGSQASKVNNIPIPFPVTFAIKIDNQAQFQPLTYVRALAQRIAGEKCIIMENTRALNIDFNKKEIVTSQGCIRADAIILATHTPLGFNPLQTVIAPYREYAIAAQMSQLQFYDGIYWTMEQPSHSIRAFTYKGVTYLVAIGEIHKTGHQDNNQNYYDKVEKFARAFFPIEKVNYYWAAQNYHPADSLPYIGESFGYENIYVATGFGTNGLIYGPLAASILADKIIGKENRWAHLYDSRRITPLKSAEDFIKENIDVAAQYAKDYLFPVSKENIDSIKPGEGRVVEMKGQKIAVCRNENGELKSVKPGCTHLNCMISWNKHDMSWDCPCHGSRFTPEGEVIEGPAMAKLEVIGLP